MWKVRGNPKPQTRRVCLHGLGTSRGVVWNLRDPRFRRFFKQTPDETSKYLTGVRVKPLENPSHDVNNKPQKVNN